MEYPDADLILMQRLDEELGPPALARKPWTDTAFPEDSEENGMGWEEIFPIIIVQRLPAGGISDDGLVDRALMAVLCIDKTRALSQKVSREVRRAILNDEECWHSEAENTKWLVEPCSEVASPSLEPDFDPDNIFVESSFWLPISLRG